MALSCLLCVPNFLLLYYAYNLIKIKTDKQIMYPQPAHFLLEQSLLVEALQTTR